VKLVKHRFLDKPRGDAANLADPNLAKRTPLARIYKGFKITLIWPSELRRGG